MKRNNVAKAVGLFLAVVVVGVIPASTARADYKISSDGCSLELVAPKGATSQQNTFGEIYLYDSNGNVAKKQTASGYLVDYVYDQNGNQTKVVEHKYAGEPWGTISILYDAFQRPAYEVDAFGAVLAKYEYKDNVVTKTSADFPYDTWTYTYDTEGRMIKYEVGTDQSYTYTYDKLGNVIKLVEANIYGDEIIVDLTYDQYNNIVTVHKHGNEGTEETFVYKNVYDALGRLTYSSNGVDYECSFKY